MLNRFFVIAVAMVFGFIGKTPFAYADENKPTGQISIYSNYNNEDRIILHLYSPRGQSAEQFEVRFEVCFWNRECNDLAEGKKFRLQGVLTHFKDIQAQHGDRPTTQDVLAGGGMGLLIGASGAGVLQIPLMLLLSIVDMALGTGGKVSDLVRTSGGAFCVPVGAIAGAATGVYRVYRSSHCLEQFTGALDVVAAKLHRGLDKHKKAGAVPLIEIGINSRQEELSKIGAFIEAALTRKPLPGKK